MIKCRNRLPRCLAASGVAALALAALCVGSSSIVSVAQLVAHLPVERGRHPVVVGLVLLHTSIDRICTKMQCMTNISNLTE